MQKNLKKRFQKPNLIKPKPELYGRLEQKSKANFESSYHKWIAMDSVHNDCQYNTSLDMLYIEYIKCKTIEDWQTWLAYIENDTP